MPQYPPLRQYPSFHVAVSMRLEDREMLVQLAQRHHTTNSALVRRLIWEEARREKLTALEPTQKGEPT